MLTLTSLRARIEKGTSGLDGHRMDCTIGDLGTGVAAAAVTQHVVRLRGLPAEVPASDHFIRGRLAPESTGDQDLLGGRLPADGRGRLGGDDRAVGFARRSIS